MAERPLVDELDQVVDSVLAGATLDRTSDPELQSLAAVADVLRLLPSEEFKNQLKADLQRSVSMNAGLELRAGFRAVSPLVIHERAPELVEFLKRTFGAEELRRDTSEQAYGFYAEVGIGDRALMIGGGAAAEHGNLPGAFHVFVDDCDAAYGRALAAGAKTLAGTVGEPADRPYGERSAFVEDPFGNYWYIATRLGSGSSVEGPDADMGSVVPFLHPQASRKYIGFLKEAFAAEEVMVIEHGGRVVHGAVRIGDAVLEMGDAENRSGIPSGGLFVRVKDVEAAYAKAIAAGATVVRPPADIPYGYRSAIVKDAEGFLWWMARPLERA
jgi:PhnB protein